MSTLQPLDYTAIIIYMLIMAGMGLSLGFFIKNVGDYFKGGSTIPWYVGGISNFMSLFSAFVFVAHAGIAYEHGLVAMAIIWSAVPAMLVGAMVFSKLWRRAGISSPMEFLEIRFNSNIRQIFSWGGIGFRMLNNMVRLYAIGVFVSTATPLSLSSAILIGGIIVLIYTVVGGLWAVVLTDVVQFVVLICATCILVPLSLKAVGGLEQLAASMPKHFSLTNGPKGEWSYLLVYYLMITVKHNGNWAFIQRFYSVKDEAAGRKMGLLSAGLFFIFPIFFLLPAIAAGNLLPGLENPEMAYVSVALELLPTGVMGIMLAAMFAATMSSLDSEYNVIASVVTSDIYQRLFKPQANEKELMWVARISTLVIGALVMIGALFVDRFGGAFEASKLFASLFAIPLIIPILLGVLLRNANASGALLSMVVGVITGLVLNAMPDISWQMATFITILICILTFGGSGLWTKRSLEQEKKIKTFFDSLSTNIKDENKPNIAPDFKRVLLTLFIIALAAVGILFLIMSWPSSTIYSGRLAMIAGGCCLAIALALYTMFIGRKFFTF